MNGKKINTNIEEKTIAKINREKNRAETNIEKTRVIDQNEQQKKWNA